MSGKRRPWMKWYPADWRADPRLRMCSFAARGLWADLITLMHEAEPYGHLVTNGITPSIGQLARLLGGSEKEVTVLLGELEAAGVFSRSDDGTIYSRRMVRDKEKADADSKNGKGGGNPKITKRDKAGVNPQANRSVAMGDKAHMPEARVKPSQGLVSLLGGLSQSCQDRAGWPAAGNHTADDVEQNPFDPETGEVA